MNYNAKKIYKKISNLHNNYDVIDNIIILQKKLNLSTHP